MHLPHQTFPGPFAPKIKRFGRESVQYQTCINLGKPSKTTDTYTHTQKHGSDSMTSTADAGGNKITITQGSQKHVLN